MEPKMEVTLEKIELVRDRTGVSYKEAKDALEAAEGSVVDAIIAIEESIDTLGMTGGVTRDVAAKKDELVGKMKDVVKKGGVSKIRVTRDGETILNIPLIAGVLGAVVAPWGLIAGTVAALGTKCKLEFVKDDGSTVDLQEKASDIYDQAMVKGSDLYESVREMAPENVAEGMEAFRNKAQETFSELKEKAPGSFDELKNRAQETYNDLKEKAPGSFDELKNRAQDTYNDLKEKAPGSFDELKNRAQDTVTRAQGTVSDLRDKAVEKTDNPKFDEFKNKFDELWSKGGEAVNKAKETVAKPVRSFKEGMKDEVEEIVAPSDEIELVFGDLDADVAEDLSNLAAGSEREMSQLEKDLLEMQKAAAEGIKEFEEEVNN